MNKNSKNFMSAMLVATMAFTSVSQAVFAQDFETEPEADVVTDFEVTNEADQTGPGKPISPKNSTVYELKTYLNDVEEKLKNDPNSSVLKTQKQEVESILDRYESTPVYRLYNYYSGEHLYTSDPHERATLINYGWKDEEIGWYAPVNSGDQVYRLYNPNQGDHHYTTSANERDALVGYGWKYEEVDWKSMESDDVNAHPIYRQYNPNAYAANHNYTPSSNERRTLISYGWKDEEIGWYSLSEVSKVTDGGGTRIYDNDNLSMLTGWQNIYGDRYYLDPTTGYMATGETRIDGKTYYFDNNGCVLKGTHTIGAETHYLDGDTGAALTGYQILTGSQTGSGPRIVYLSDTGVIMKNYEVNGMKFDADGDKEDLTTSEVLTLNDLRVYDEVGRDLEGCFDWVAKNIKDNNQKPQWPTPPNDTSVQDYLAMQGFANKKGDCYVIAATFAELARGLGYNPTLVRGGLKTVSGQNEHCWVEITIDGKEYVFDPYMNSSSKNFPKNYCYKQDKNNTTFVYVR